MVGWILLGLLVLLLLLPWIPLYLVGEYVTDTPVLLQLRWLFVRISLDPKRLQERGKKSKKPKKTKETKAAKSSKKQSKDKAKKSPEELIGFLQLLLECVKSAKKGLLMLLRSFKFTRMQLYVVIATGDAAQTAITYGKINAAVYGLYTALQSFLPMTQPVVQISPDFVSDKGRVAAYVTGRLVPALALLGIIRGGVAALLTFMRLKKSDVGKGAGRKKRKPTKVPPKAA